MRDQEIKPTLPLGLYFMLVGPMVGLGLVLTGIFVYAIIDMRLLDLGGVVGLFKIFPVFAIYGLVVACIVGPLPALITGMVARRGKTNAQQIVYAMGAGAVTCVLASLIIDRGLVFSSAALVFGCVSGLCVMVLRQRSIDKLNR